MSVQRFVLVCSVLVLCISAGLEICRIYCAPHLWKLVRERVDKKVVWQRDSAPDVQARFNGSLEAEDLTVKFYMMNLTNAKGVRLGDVPVVEEVGPYTFVKKRPRGEIEWSKDGKSVEFLEGTEHYFLRNLSVGGLDDVMTTLNIPLVGALEVVMARSPSRVSPVLQLVLRILEGWSDKHMTGIFTSRSVRELLFGYEDPLLSKLSHIIPGFDSKFELIPNVTYENGDQMRMMTGADSLENVAEMTVWKGVENVGAWEEEEKVRGTNGMQFAPSITQDAVDLVSSRRVWVGDLFRSIRLDAEDGMRHLKGAAYQRFVPDDSVFSPSPRYYQEYEGLMNISSPISSGIDGERNAAGPKLFLSLPGFCKVEDRVRETVQGVSCDPERHSIYLDVEPVTGVTIRAKKTLMLSSWFGASYSVVEPSVKDAFLPIFWAEEVVKAGDKELKVLSKLTSIISLYSFFMNKSQSISILCLIAGLPAFVACILTRTTSQEARSQKGSQVHHDDDMMEEGESDSLLQHQS
eukprot:jgi/Picsp_1/672/NSC_00667-R1_scavenger receptor class member 2